MSAQHEHVEPRAETAPSDTLAAALPREMVRVTKLIPIYRSVPMGFMAAACMEVAVDQAQQAIADGNVIAMIRAYESLKGFTL